MSISIDAVYENGILRPLQPLFLPDQRKVRITVEEAGEWVQRTRGIVPCSDEALVHWAAMDPDLEYDFGHQP